LTQHFNGWTANLFYEKTHTNLFQGGFIDRTPEFKPSGATTWCFSAVLAVSNFRQYGRTFESFRKSAPCGMIFNSEFPSIPFRWETFSFHTGSMYHQNFYDTGNFFSTQRFSARYMLGDVSQIRGHLGNHLEAVLDYRSQSNIDSIRCSTIKLSLIVPWGRALRLQ